MDGRVEHGHDESEVLGATFPQPDSFNRTGARPWWTPSDGVLKDVGLPKAF
jgi:hypothetical protein